MKIDDKVLARNHSDTHWEKGHFAGYDDNNKPQAFMFCQTSKQTKNITTWDTVIAFDKNLPINSQFDY